MAAKRWNRSALTAGVATAVALGVLAVGTSDASATSPPMFTVASPGNNSTAPSRAVTFAGTGKPGSAVSILDASGSPVPGTLPAVVGANSDWTTTGTFPTSAPVAEHLTASQVTGGSVSATAPIVINLPPRTSHLFAITGPSSNVTVPSRTVTFTGTGIAGSMVSILDAGGTKVPGTTPATVGSNGIWTTTGTFPTSAPAAEHLTASQVTGGTASLLIHLPATMYPFAVTWPPDKSTVTSRTVTFTGTGVPGSTVSILDAGGNRVPGTSPAAVGSNGIWSVAATFAESKPHVERVVVTQVTRGAPDRTTFLVISLPAATHPFAVTSLASNATVASRTVTFTGTGLPGSTVSILDAGGTRVPGTSPAAVNPSGAWSTTRTFATSAPVTEHLVANQVTGGSVDGSVPVTLHLPARAYPFALTAPANNATVPSQTVTFTGTGVPGSLVNILDTTGAALPGTSPSEVDTDGNWSLNATFASTAAVTEQLVASQSTTGTDSGAVPFTIHLPAAPAIALSTTSSRPSFTAPGQVITYRYQVTNTGNVTLGSVGLSNPIGAADLRCPAAVLAPGASETCTGAHTTTQADVDVGSLNSSATAVGTPPTGSAVTSLPSSMALPGPPSSPAIALLTSSSRPSFTAPGQVITYRYLVTNTGNVTLGSVGLSDNRIGAADLRCPAAVLAPGASEICTGAYTTTLADVHARSVVSSAVAQGTPPRTTTPVPSNPSTSIVPLAVNPHITAVAHKAPVSPSKLQVTG